LRTPEGYLLENFWQAKLYPNIPKVNIPYSRYDQRIIWSHPAETHIDANGDPNKKYWAWRKKLLNASDAVRYPAGFNNRHNCIGNIIIENGEYGILDYIESRKRIYLPIYLEAVKRAPKFQELKKRYQNGENLLIIEIDGPHQEDIEYYKEKYPNIAWEEKMIGNTIEIDREILEVMLNDPKNPYGHSYCLAWALMDD
jgi:hypothetical protein